MRTLIRISRVLAAFILLLLALLTLTEFSPIYKFSAPTPFGGEYVYNPYAESKPESGWKKANFHTHTHAHKWFNECEFEADSVISFYRRFGYDIVSITNHMEITDSGLVPSYEHGWNICKLHNLVINPFRVRYWDFFIPFLTSQRQFKIDRLARTADFVFQNHPDRITFLDEADMVLLTGYRLVEADCGFDPSSTKGRKWDAALSAGHYVPSAISDDLHRPKNSYNFARRCNFINCASTSYEDVKDALLKGCFYSMHLPDFGEGDWSAKLEAHLNLPSIDTIGVSDSLDVFMALTTRAASIEAIGQCGDTLATVSNASGIKYRFRPEDTYVRLVARFDDGSVLFTNPFARWSGSSDSLTPYVTAPHPVCWPLTILFNLSVLLLASLLILAGRRLIRKK